MVLNSPDRRLHVEGMAARKAHQLGVARNPVVRGTLASSSQARRRRTTGSMRREEGSRNKVGFCSHLRCVTRIDLRCYDTIVLSVYAGREEAAAKTTQGGGACSVCLGMISWGVRVSVVVVYGTLGAGRRCCVRSLPESWEMAEQRAGSSQGKEHNGKGRDAAHTLSLGSISVTSSAGGTKVSL